MLNKYFPIFIIWAFAAISCTSSFPVTFYGSSFKDYVKHKVTGNHHLDSHYVTERHPIQTPWKLVAFDEYRYDHMHGYIIEELDIQLYLTNEEYIPESNEFIYPLYCHGKGVHHEFKASYKFDDAGHIRFIDFSSIPSAFLKGIEAIEERYLNALRTASNFSVEVTENGRPYALYIYHKKGVLIFKSMLRSSPFPNRPYSVTSNLNDTSQTQ